MTEDDLRAAVANAADADALRAVVRACADRMRTDGLVNHPGLASVLTGLAAHESEKVRRAVADACDAFPDPFFDRALAPLASDVDHYVRVAAERAAERRAARRKASAAAREDDDALEAALAEIAEKWGKAARRLAERVARRAVGNVLVRLLHEVSKVEDAIERALAAQRAELESPHPSIAALKKHDAVVRERVGFLRAMLRRGLEYVHAREPVFAEESLAAIVEEAHSQLVARAGDKAIAFSTDVDPAITLRVDRHALLQALQNVLQNAVEAYASEGPRPVRVEARTRRAGSEVVIAIADRGAGMTEATKARLFVPFATTKRGGTGVGLSIARTAIVDVHGGEVTLESAPGEGTVVTLVLPTRRREKTS